MKKLILTAAAVLAFGFTNAQDMKFGVKAGLNIASTNAKEVEPFKLSSAFGVNAGVFAEFKISDKFAVQPELLFSMQGQKAKASEGSASVESSTTLNYINIPVIAKYFVTEKLSLQVGPQIGFLISASKKITSNVEEFFPSGTTDVKNGYNGVDFGLNFGAGFDITENISVDARYNLGLSDLQKDLPSGVTGTKNRVFSINLGYKF